VGEWKAILDAIADLVDDAMFICNDDGITFRGMDPARVSLLDVTFPKFSFKKLESKTSFFSIRVEDFQKIMNAANTNDVVELQIENMSAMKVLINGAMKMEFNIRLLQRTEVNTPIPKISYKSKISIDPSALGRILTNLNKISGYVRITCFPNKVEFTGKGDLGDAKIDIEKGNPDLHEILSSENTSGIYSLEYMAKIIRSIGKASKKVNIEYANHNPLRLQFEMPSKTKVEYYLAPRSDS